MNNWPERPDNCKKNKAYCMPRFAAIYDMKPVARDYKDEGFIRTHK